MAKKLGFIALVATVGLLVGLGVRWVNHAVASDVVQKGVTTSITSSASTDSMKVYLTGIDTSAVLQLFPGRMPDYIVDDWAVIMELKNKSKTANIAPTGKAGLDSAKIDLKIQMSEDNSTWYPTTATASFSDSCRLGKDTTVVGIHYLPRTAIPPNFKYVRFIIAGRDSGNSANVLDFSNDSTYIPRITLVGRSLFSKKVVSKFVSINDVLPTTADTSVIQLYPSTSIKEMADSLMLVTMAKQDAVGGDNQTYTVKYQVSVDGTTWVPTSSATAITRSSTAVTNGQTIFDTANLSRENIPQPYRYIRLIMLGTGSNDTCDVKHYIYGWSLYSK